MSRPGSGWRQSPDRCVPECSVECMPAADVLLSARKVVTVADQTSGLAPTNFSYDAPRVGMWRIR